MSDSPAFPILARFVPYRCFYLFVAILLQIVVGASMESTPASLAVFSVLTLLMLVAAAAIIGRRRNVLIVAMLLAATIFGLQIWGHTAHNREMVAVSRVLGLSFNLWVIIYLLRYTLRDDVLTADKLFGAAAAYLLIAELWMYVYGLLQWQQAGMFAVNGTVVPLLSLGEVIYFSVTVLTTTGFGDIAPATPVARSAVIFEQVVGVLYVAVLIARLTGVYPASSPRDRD